MLASVATVFAAVSVSTMSAGRIGAIVAGVLGLISVIVGGLALRRRERRPSVTALILGPIGLILGTGVVVTADGGLGTGTGLGGGVVAMIVGTIGSALGVLARTR